MTYQKFSLLLSLLISTIGVYAQTYPCDDVNSFNNASILLPNDFVATVDGQELPLGTTIKLLFDDNGVLTCGGSVIWEGENVILPARGADTGIVGFAIGEIYQYAIILPNGCVLTSAVATYGQNTFTNASDAFEIDGISLLETLTISTDLISTATIIPDTCENNIGAILTDVDGGTMPYSFNWSTGSNAANLENIAAGNYEATITDNTGCMIILATTVPAESCPFLEVSGTTDTTTGCAPLEVQFSNTSTVSTNTEEVLWDFGDGMTSTVSNLSHTFDNIGDYTVTLTVSDGYQTQSTIFEIEVTGALDFEFTDDALCFTPDLVLEPDCPDCSFDWNTGETTPTLAITTPGLYSVTVTNDQGCQGEDSIEIIQNEMTSTTAQLFSDCDAENGVAVVKILNGNTPYTYNWNTGATENTLADVAPGLYTVTVTDQAGCQIEEEVEVEYAPAPFVNLGNDTILCGAETILLVAGEESNTFAWNDGTTNSTLLVENSGIYSVVVSNEQNCSATDSVVIAYAENPAIDLPDVTNLCAGDTVALSAFIVDGTYEWNDGSTAAVLETQLAGNYVVTVTNDLACQTVDSTLVIVQDNPIVDLGEDFTLCEGENSILDATNENSAYLWNTEQVTPIIEVMETGNYAVTVTNEYNCMTSDAVQLDVFPMLELEFEADTTSVCGGDTINLLASGGGEYLWETLDTSFVVLSLNQNQAALYPQNSGEVRLTISNECFSDDTLFQFIAHPSPNLNATSDTIVFINTPVNLWATGADNYTWSPSTNLSCTNCPNPSSTHREDISYQLFATNEFDCSATDTVRIKVVDDVFDLITPYNVITPDGDGLNDFLIFEGLSAFPDNNITIFNRYGDVVYKAKNYQNDWNGEWKEKPLPAGTYYYVLFVGVTHPTLKSSLTIIRAKN